MMAWPHTSSKASDFEEYKQRRATMTAQLAITMIFIIGKVLGFLKQPGIGSLGTSGGGAVASCGGTLILATVLWLVASQKNKFSN